MENLDTGILENWYANRAMPVPAQLQRLAVIAPDDAPGLAALRQRLSQSGPRSLNCDHFAAGFDGAASVSLVSAFEQIRQRHATDPYDIVLLLEGRPEALGIAESNGLIPEQVSRMPVAVWTAIGEDDANTAIGDVANRVFSSPAALIDALPLQASPPRTNTVNPAPQTVQQGVTAPSLSLAIAANNAALAHLPTLPPQHAAVAAERASAHPLVLCAAGAVIVASLTAVAAMMGWLPSRIHADGGASGRPATTMTSAPVASPLKPPVTTASDRVVQTVDPAPGASSTISAPEPASEPAPLPSAPQSGSSGPGDGAALAAVGAAGLVAAAPRAQGAAATQAQRARRSPRRQPEMYSRQMPAPRQVGSNEVPVVEFVGTKSREQVIAEMVEARRASNRQAANGSYFPGLNGPSARR